MVTSYPPIHCGIGTYSSYLIDQLRELHNRVFIVCHRGGKGLDCHAVFNVHDHDLAYKAFKAMLELKPDVVHIQHEFGLFGEQRGATVIPLAYYFKLSRMPLAVTLHTVSEKQDYQEGIIEKALVNTADAVIVHEDYQRELILQRAGAKENIWVIPHGVRQIERTLQAKEKLGLSGKKIVLIIGYFRKSKNFEQMIRVFPHVEEKVKDVVLVIASGARRPEDIAYKEEFLKYAAQSEAGNHIREMHGPFSQERFDLIFSSADVVVLPYLKGAQSGILAHSLAFGVPHVVSSEVRAMAHLVQKVQSGLVGGSDSELAEAIARILTQKELAAELSANARRYVKKYLSWKVIASRHLEVYNKVQKKSG